MSGYQGMRWFKCDLQVQTPEDSRHWDLADPLRLSSPRSEADLQENARRYLSRCHEVGLEVLGVTDHNFCAHRHPRERFLAHLIEQNEAVARRMEREPLWIFPGFEVDIGYHMLCLFPPAKKSARLDEVCDILTHLGLGPAGRFDKNGPAPLRRDDRPVSLAELLRIVQEEHGGIAIAAHAFAKDGIAGEGRNAEDYTNEELLCVEVSDFTLSEREKAVLQASSGKWARPNRPPAYICSSDAKSTLPAPDGQPKPNSLGYRSTWIKMSEPSIEALRQAFLDAEARIWRETSDPRPVRHDRIVSLAVRGASFLEDQELFLSPNFNCLIGGRGSGKSSIFEYIRLALRREDDPAAAEQVGRIRRTLSRDSRLTLRWRQADDASGSLGLEDVFELDPSLARARVASRNVVDAATVFRGLAVQIFSQGQITAIAKEPSYLLELIDSLIEPRLQDLKRREAELRERVQGLQQQSRNLKRLEGERKVLEQEALDLDRKWQAQSAVEEEQVRHRRAQEAQRYLDDLQLRVTNLGRSLETRAQDLVEAHVPPGSAVGTWPESEFFASLDAAVEEAEQQLGLEIRRAVSRFREAVDAQTLESPRWSSVQAAIRRAEEDFRAACVRQGVAPESLEQLLQVDLQRKSKELELEAKRAQEAEAMKAVADFDSALASLHEVWRQETETRRQEVAHILENEAVPKVPLPGNAGFRPTIEIRIHYSADREDFLREWQGFGLGPDARTKLGRQWDELAVAAFEAFLSPQSSFPSPWEVIEDWLSGRAVPPSAFNDLLPLLRDHLRTRPELWERARLARVRDAVDLILYRPGGSEAGSLRRHQLSDGQRNTAILTLLLASGRGPMLIDQPEDELDSSFIFQQLVPLLRKIKNERQVIVTTHNPNLPVNADAELVYALTAEASFSGTAHGVVRAQGGLDRQEVKRAVLDIMEGSEEAFRRRREKYHFRS